MWKLGCRWGKQSVERYAAWDNDLLTVGRFGKFGSRLGSKIINIDLK